MPRGTLDTKLATSVPAQAQLYSAVPCIFTDVDALEIKYRTTWSAIHDLIPSEFELDDQPLVTLTVCNFGFSPFGAYTELITLVEVVWKGEKYDYSLELILENEGALFMGREQLGVPKVIGCVLFDKASVPRPPGNAMASIERPRGYEAIRLYFTPLERVQQLQKMAVDPNTKKRIALRILPAADWMKGAQLREHVTIHTVCREAEIWTGIGQVKFASNTSVLTAKLPIIEYVGSRLLRRAELEQVQVEGE